MNNCICILRQLMGSFMQHHVATLGRVTSAARAGQQLATVRPFGSLRIQFGPGLGSSSWLHWGRAWKLFGCTRKAAGLVHGTSSRSWVRVQDNNRSKWLRNQCIVLWLRFYFIEQRNGGASGGRLSASNSARKLQPARLPGIQRQRLASQKNNLFTAIMRCEFMPLPGGTTTNSHLKCDKNSANGRKSKSKSKSQAKMLCTMRSHRITLKRGAWPGRFAAFCRNDCQAWNRKMGFQ